MDSLLKNPNSLSLSPPLYNLLSLSTMDDAFPAIVSNLQASVDEIVSASHPGAPALFAALIERLKPILHALDGVASTPPIEKVVESLSAELRHARSLVGDPDASPPSVQVEIAARRIGRCLGLLLLVWADPPPGIQERTGALKREMAAVQFGGRDIVPDVEELTLRVKKGDEEELGSALSELGLLVRDGLAGEVDGRLIQALVNRLASSANEENRLEILLLLRSLVFSNGDFKERMEGIDALSTVVHSLARDIEESREAAGLLLDLSSITKVRQRIGRIQGCIVMLVGLLNGADLCASHYAGKLLGVLSSNIQNVLLMAEACYFMPLVQYLKEGTAMNKVLVATAISRMELTDEMKCSLGEEGSIEPLVKMFTSGKLEAKLSALGALRNISSLTGNIPHLINSGVVPHLLQLLFSVTSVLLTLREPAAAILASIAKSELILKYKDVAQRMLSLLSLSSPAIQLHLLLALSFIASHSTARKAKARMKENGAIQLLLTYLKESNSEIRVSALTLLFYLTQDFPDELLGEADMVILVDIIATSSDEKEKAAAINVLSNIPVKDKRATEILVRANLLPLLTTLLELIMASSSPTRSCLLEGIAGLMVRFTVPWDKKLQRASASYGVIPHLVKLLSEGSSLAKRRAATSLTQLSQNSLASDKKKPYRWLCGPPPRSQSFCEVHDARCLVKSTFCLVKAGAVSPLVRILEGKEREADEAVLDALSTLMQEEIWERGANAIERASGVEAIIGVVEVGSLKARERAIWMLERMLRLESLRVRYGEAARVVLVDLVKKDDPSLKSMVAEILARLQPLP